MSEGDFIRPYITYSPDDLLALVKRYRENDLVRNAVIRELAMRNDPSAEEILKKLAGSQQADDRFFPGAGRTKPDWQRSNRYQSQSTTSNSSWDARRELESGLHSKPPNHPEGDRHVHRQPRQANQSLTDEQRTAVDMFCGGESLRINAFAGTGKTTTLRAIASQSKQRGLYLCFNRRLAEEAKAAFPSHVKCRTIHSLAYVYVRDLHGMAAKLEGAFTASMLHKIITIEPVICGQMQFGADEIRQLTWNTLRAYCFSHDIDIETSHVPAAFSQRLLTSEERSTLKQYVVDRAKAVWQQMIDPRSNTPLGHDGYLKYWSLCRPKIEADYLLLDEAQDTNPVVLGVLSQQSLKIAFVGDRYQQIYEWRGAVNAMDARLASKTTYLTKSFRFGNTIAAHANRVLQKLGEQRQLEGCGPSRREPGDSLSRAILARTNARLLEELVNQIKLGERPWLEGGTGELREYLQGLYDLKANRPSRHPEFYGIRNWRELLDFANSEEGKSIQGLLHLVNKLGFQSIFQAIDFVDRNAETSSLTLSTLHKAKGREWDNVELLDDFRTPEDASMEKNAEEAAEELRINYVAITRAKHQVTLPEKIGIWLYKNK